MSKDDLDRLSEQERRHRMLKKTDPNYNLRSAEQVDSQQITNLIDIVTRIIKAQDPNFKANRRKLARIIQNSNRGADIVEEQPRLARKNKNLIVDIVREKPFSSANPFAAIIIVREFLLNSDYILPIEKIVGLSVVLVNTPDDRLESEVERYLQKNITRFT